MAAKLQRNKESSPTKREMSGDIPQAKSANNAKVTDEVIPQSPVLNKFLIPSPLPTRRNRTYSSSEKISAKKYKGKVKEFCRNKGHGFILCDDTKETLFVHISDIDDEYVPKEGDEVEYKLCPLPLNPSKQQAVHVRITHPAKGVVHETWNASPPNSPRS